MHDHKLISIDCPQGLGSLHAQKPYLNEEACSRAGSKTQFHFNIWVPPFKYIGLESVVVYIPLWLAVVEFFQ
jgi:hypothetical protein